MTLKRGLRESTPVTWEGGKCGENLRVRAIVFNIGTVESTIHLRLGLVISGNIRICVFGRSRSEMLIVIFLF